MLHHDAWAGDPLGCYRVGQRQRGGSVRGNRGAKHTVGRLSQPSQPSLNPLASHPLVAAEGRAMSKSDELDDMRDEYDFSEGVRGKYAARFAEGSNVIVLDPDVAEAFPDGRAVNEALRVLARAMKKPSERAS